MQYTRNFKHFEKEMVVKANVLPIVQTVKNLVRPLSNKRCFRTSFESQHVKESETLGKPAWEHFYHIFSSLWWEINLEINQLLICQVFGVFFNRLAADDKYRLQDCEILSLLIQMKLSKNRKKCSQFFVPFMELKWNFENFQKKCDRHS